MTKPFSPPDLLGRIGAVLRRTGSPSQAQEDDRCLPSRCEIQAGRTGFGFGGPIRSLLPLLQGSPILAGMSTGSPDDADPRLRELLTRLSQDSSAIDQILLEFPELTAREVLAALALEPRPVVNCTLPQALAPSSGRPSGKGTKARGSVAAPGQLGLFPSDGAISRRAPGQLIPTSPRPRLPAPSQPMGPAPQPQGPRPAPTPDEERISLFKNLFRGREDVFAVRWENRQTGDSGYWPKRRGGKSGQDVPLSDWWVSAHRRGSEVIGAYAILEDDTCWFLAVDFDEAEWRADVAAFRQVCTETGIPCAVEISRSGNGAHAWFFFSAPVPAASARQMGTYLLTLTTARRDQLTLKSYDRLFPSQDTLPRKGGYGNLIALPLQGRRIPEGCTVFVDEAFEPCTDQWAFLASIPRIEPGQVIATADLADRQGLDFGFLPEVPIDEEATAPWERSPSRRVPPLRIQGPLPPLVNAVLCQRLFIEREGLPPALIDRIRRLAAFKNPVFFRNQRLRLSNHETPPLICCTEEHPRHIGLPRGCVGDARDFLRKYDVDLQVEDRRHAGTPATWSFTGSLRPSQARAVEALVAHDLGVYVAPPGTGKTVVGVAMIAERRCSTLVIVHLKTLLDQWRSQIAMWLGLDPDDVGQIGGGKRKPNGSLDVAMVQSLDKKEGERIWSRTTVSSSSTSAITCRPSGSSAWWQKPRRGTSWD